MARRPIPRRVYQDEDRGSADRVHTGSTMRLTRYHGLTLEPIEDREAVDPPDWFHGQWVAPIEPTLLLRRGEYIAVEYPESSCESLHDRLRVFPVETDVGISRYTIRLGCLTG